MCVALVGGMDRLKQHYIKVDAVIIFTNKVSYNAKKEVMDLAKAKKIPVYMYHSCGICTLRNCIKCLKNRQGEC